MARRQHYRSPVVRLSLFSTAQLSSFPSHSLPPRRLSYSLTMPSFLNNLRRSRPSFRTDKSSSKSDGSPNGHIRTNKSSSTLNSTPESTTPPSTLPSEDYSSNFKGLNGNTPPLPSRPPINTTRYSINVRGTYLSQDPVTSLTCVLFLEHGFPGRQWPSEII